jgi:hypothetical protein
LPGVPFDHEFGTVALGHRDMGVNEAPAMTAA